MSKETIRINGETKGKIDIVRNINKIPDRQYLNDLFKINKQMNENKVRPAFGSDADPIVLNNELPVETAALRQSVQHQKGPNLLEQVTKPIPSTYNSGETYSTQTPNEAKLLFSNGAGNIIQQGLSFQETFNEQPTSQPAGHLKRALNNLVISLSSGSVIYLRDFGEQFLGNISDGQQFQDVILTMAENLPEKTLRFLLKLTQEFIEKKMHEILQILKIFISTESVLFCLIEEILKDYNSNLSYEFISSKYNEILQKIRSYYLSLNPNVTNRETLTQCLQCGGKYVVCNL